MIKTALLSTLTTFLIATAFEASVFAAEPVLQVAGLRIIAPGIGEDGHELRAYSWSVGTSVAIRLKSTEGGLLGVDESASVLSLFTDDKGTDLTKENPGSFSWGQNGFGNSTEVSADGTQVLFEINGQNVPVAGASSLNVRGEIGLIQAKTSASETIHAIAMKVGTKIKAAAVEYEIIEISKPSWGDAEIAITVKTESDLGLIKDLKFVDAQGVALEVERGMSSSTGWNGKTTSEITYNFTKKVDAFDLVIESWTDRTVKKVPFELKVNVGLNP